MFLDLRAESSGHSPSSDDRPEAVVALRAIAAARARPSMIPETVRDPVAQGAIAIRACDGNTEPHAEKHAKKGSIQVKPKGFRRPGQQPRPGARLLKKLKVCPLGFSFGRHLKLSKLGLVQGRRQGLLPGLVNSMETVGSKDGSIKRSRRLHRRRPIRRVPTIEAPASFMGGGHGCQVSSRGMDSALPQPEAALLKTKSSLVPSSV